MSISLIVAAARNDVIGSGGALPWYLPEDLRRFRRLTVGRPVVVGRITHESIVARLGKPLPKRTSVVVTSRATNPPDPSVIWVGSPDSALESARASVTDSDGEVFVIGGATVYQQLLPRVDQVYLTRLHRDIDGDTVMPPGWLDGFVLTAREDRPDDGYSWLDYRRDRP